MGFGSRDEATEYTPQDDDTLETIARRETENGNPLTWRELAAFNWGTDQREAVEAYLRDELGCYRRGPDKYFVISADAEGRGSLLIPRRYTQEGLGTEAIHTFHVRRRPAPPRQLSACTAVRGIAFDRGSSFPGPAARGDLRLLVGLLDEHAEAKILLLGHTDPGESETEDKALSERRATAVFALLTHQPDLWEELYNDEEWGLAPIQRILRGLGADYEPGTVDGTDGDSTRAALRRFQGDHGLGDSGEADSDTREALFRAYMEARVESPVDEGRFTDPAHMGCAAINRVRATDDPCPDNRRVSVYLFDENRLPALPCTAGDLAPCERQQSEPMQRYCDSFRCSFYDSLVHGCPSAGPEGPAGLFRFVITDDENQPVEFREPVPFKVQDESGEVVHEGEVASGGRIEFPAEPGGRYALWLDGEFLTFHEEDEDEESGGAGEETTGQTTTEEGDAG